MKISHVIILLAFAISGCDNNPTGNYTNYKNDLKVKGVDSTKVNSDFIIHEFTMQIDTIYKLDSDLYTLSEIDFEKEQRRNALAFNQNGLKHVLRYGSFLFLEFESENKALSSFSEVGQIFKNNMSGGGLHREATKEGFKIMYDVISKGGASFTLKENYIIQKLGSCSGTFEELVTNEEELLRYLFRNDKDASNYYFKYCCACSRKYSMVYK